MAYPSRGLVNEPSMNSAGLQDILGLISSDPNEVALLTEQLSALFGAPQPKRDVRTADFMMSVLNDPSLMPKPGTMDYLDFQQAHPGVVEKLSNQKRTPTEAPAPAGGFGGILEARKSLLEALSGPKPKSSGY